MGSYVQSNLVSGESVVYEAKLHWITFISLRAIFTLFIAPLEFRRQFQQLSLS
jgi:hypothetical protein